MCSTSGLPQTLSLPYCQLDADEQEAKWDGGVTEWNESVSHFLNMLESCHPPRRHTGTGYIGEKQTFILLKPLPHCILQYLLPQSRIF